MLWAAYLRGSFSLPKMDEKAFTEWIYQASSRMRLYGIEDEHAGFKAGRGLIGLVSVTTDGWLITPVAEFFKWAKPKHVLRGVVAFFQMYRYSPEGVCMVMAAQKDKRLLHRMMDYGVLFFRCTIPHGRRDGEMLIYSIAARRK